MLRSQRPTRHAGLTLSRQCIGADRRLVPRFTATGLSLRFVIQYLLPDQSDHHGVLGIVVGRIAVGDILHGSATDERDDAGVGRLQHAINACVHPLQFVNERFDDDCVGLNMVPLGNRARHTSSLSN